jgi:hypothetical protein
VKVKGHVVVRGTVRLTVVGGDGGRGRGRGRGGVAWRGVARLREYHHSTGWE